MKFENAEVFNFESALRGMRNPMNSWDKSDSKNVRFGEAVDYDDSVWNSGFLIGKNDLELAQKLIKAGSEHRKFMRQIFVSVDITAPLYWWKEFDTYKIGTTANSTSTMHKLATTPITKDFFEMDDFEKDTIAFHDEDLTDDYKGNFDTVEYYWNQLVQMLETLRINYLETKDKKYWKELIRLLPESWLQTRTVTMSYENIFNMYHQRKNHKLTEWSKSFIEWVESLPYAKELLIN